MWQAIHALQTTARSSAVWALWADPSRWPEWNDGIAEARVEGAFAVGSTARIRFKRSGSLRFTITALEPERLFVDETRLPGARLGHEHRLERRAGITEISNRLYIDGPASWVYALLLGRRMRASVRRFVERERELAEAPSATRLGSD